MPSRNKTYRIGEAAALLGVKPSVLRFWETEFPELAPQRRESGQRRYTTEDMELLRRIRELLYVRGLTIEGARHALRRSASSRALPTEEKEARSRELEERRQNTARRRRENALRRRQENQLFLQDVMTELRAIYDLLKQADKGTAT